MPKPLLRQGFWCFLASSSNDNRRHRKTLRDAGDAAYVQRRKGGHCLGLVLNSHVGVLHRHADVRVTGELLGLHERGDIVDRARDVGVPPARGALEMAT